VISVSKEVEIMGLEYEGLKVRNIRLVDEVAHFPKEVGELKGELNIAHERLEIKEVEIKSLQQLIEDLTQRIFNTEKDAEEKAVLISKVFFFSLLQFVPISLLC